MRSLLIRLLGTAISFALTQYLVEGFVLKTTLTSYFFTALTFVVVSFFVSPLLKLILFPINLLTLGIFRFFINVLVLYIFDLIYGGLTISAYTFRGLHSPLLTLPQVELSLFWVLTLSAVVMSLSYTLFTSFFRD